MLGTTDYSVDVIVIDVPEKKEKQLNVSLNHQGAQGDWDREKLADLFQEEGVKLDDFLFDQMEAALVFEGTEFETIFSESAQAPAVTEALAAFEEMAPNGRMENGDAIRDPEAHAALIAEREKMREKMKAANEERDPKFYLIVVCSNRAERDVLAEAVGATGEYIAAGALAAKLGVELPD